MQSFGNYNINPNPPVYVGGGEKRKKKKEEKPSEDIASKIALPIAVTAGAALAICAGVFGVNKALGGGKKVVGETAKKTAGTVKETAKKANKTIHEQQQEISKILRNLQVGNQFKRDEATQLTKYLTAYNSALTLGGYQGINITSYTQLITNFINKIKEKFKDPSVKETLIAEEKDPLIQDIGKINEMFTVIESLAKSQNQQHDADQMIAELDIEVEEEKPKKPNPSNPPVQNPVAKFEFVNNQYKKNSFLQNLNVEKLSSLNPQHIACCVLSENTHVLVIDSNGLTLDKTPDEASSVKFDGAEANAYLYKLEDTMSPSDMTTLLGSSKITSALVSQIGDNFLQQYLIKQLEKVNGAKAKELKAMLVLTEKVTETIKADESNGVIKAILDANTNLISKIQQEQQQQLNATLKAFDDDQNSSKLFKNFENLKTFISDNSKFYNIEANSTYYIDSNNNWTKFEGEEKVPDNAKFVISVGGKTTYLTITKKVPYCELTYDKDGHIAVKATPAKKYIEIITAPEEALKKTDPPLQCNIDQDTKQKALDELKTLLKDTKFKAQYKKARGDKYDEDFKSAGKKYRVINLSGGILTQLLNADLDTAINLLKPTKKNKDILAALKVTTISTIYKEQRVLTAEIKVTKNLPYLKEMLASNTTSKKLPLFSGDSNEEYITKIDGDKTVYTTNEETPKEYTVTYDNSNNTVAITVDENTYTYTVSETECTLAENVPDKDLFEHFVYMALRDDPAKQKMFAKKLLSLERDSISSSMDKKKKAKVVRLIALSNKDLYEKMIKGMLDKGDKKHLYIDKDGTILETVSDETKYVSFYKETNNRIIFKPITKTE